MGNPTAAGDSGPSRRRRSTGARRGARARARGRARARRSGQRRVAEGGARTAERGQRRTVKAEEHERQVVRGQVLDGLRALGVVVPRERRAAPVVVVVDHRERADRIAVWLQR